MKNQKIGKLLEWKAPLLVLQFLFLVLAVYFQSRYLIGCGGILLWLGIARLRVQKCVKPAHALLLVFPVAILCALSAAPLFLNIQPGFSVLQTAVFCLLIGVQALMLLLCLIFRRKETDGSVWAARHFEISLLCTLLAALVSQLLLLGEPGEWAQMVCLTGCVMGGGILLLGCNLALCTLCKRQDTRESIQLVRQEFQRRRRIFHFVSVGKDGFMVLVKVGMSLISTSFFMFANALFSCGIGLARYTALKMPGKEPFEQRKLYRAVGAILCFSGLCYAGYSVRLFFGGSAGQYSEVMALAIAAYTFVEFGIQIYDLIKLRKHRDLEAKALRLVSLCGILVSFVLTQTAIMSFSEQAEHNFSDGLAGVAFGGLVMLVGVIMQLYWFTGGKYVRKKNNIA